MIIVSPILFCESIFKIITSVPGASPICRVQGGRQDQAAKVGGVAQVPVLQARRGRARVVDPGEAPGVDFVHLHFGQTIRVFEKNRPK
jgi:hypothetical protein